MANATMNGRKNISKKKINHDIFEKVIDNEPLFAALHWKKDTTVAFQYLHIDLRLGIQDVS